MGSRNDLTVFQSSLKPGPALIINIPYSVCTDIIYMLETNSKATNNRKVPKNDTNSNYILRDSNHYQFSVAA